MKSTIFTLSLLFFGANAFAQVPSHAEGQICFTAYSWCWADTYTAPGSGDGSAGWPCGCPGPYGWVDGTLSKGTYGSQGNSPAKTLLELLLGY